MSIKVFMLILAQFLCTNAQAEVNFIDQFGKDNLAWQEDNQKIAGTMSDFGLYSLMGGAILYVSLDRSWKHGLAATATLGVNAGLNQLVKHQVGRERPDGSDRLSFYSGHSAGAAFGAGLFCLTNKKLCVPAMGLATTVGYLRIAANRHWSSDVLCGLGIGYVNGRYLPTLLLRW